MSISLFERTLKVSKSSVLSCAAVTSNNGFSELKNDITLLAKHPYQLLRIALISSPESRVWRYVKYKMRQERPVVRALVNGDNTRSPDGSDTSHFVHHYFVVIIIEPFTHRRLHSSCDKNNGVKLKRLILIPRVSEIFLDPLVNFLSELPYKEVLIEVQSPFHDFQVFVVYDSARLPGLISERPVAPYQHLVTRTMT